MTRAEIKKGTHVVFKIDDIKKYLTKEQLSNLLDIETTIILNRKVDGKKVNDYYVINTDEPYAKKVLDIILEEEGKKI